MNLSGLKAIALLVLVGAAFLAVGLDVRYWYSPEWLVPDTTQNPPGVHPWTVEADCYSQMARVHRILGGQGLLQNHFQVENWPEGLVPSTTAPFDYVILLLYVLIWPFTKDPLDWAGALISPALWVALIGFWLLIRSREFNALGRAVLIAGSAMLPSLVWGTAFGRPRHVSMILVLVAMGLTAEYERWQLELTPKRAWNIFAGLVWGLACWTSLFEPVVFVGCIVLFNLIVHRRENVTFLTAFGAVVLVMIALEGGHIAGNLQQIYELRNSPYAINWLHGIAEVTPKDFAGLLSELSIVVLATPIVAWCLWPREYGNRTDVLLILLTGLLTYFNSWEGRWSYYASMAGLFLLARFIQAPRAPVNGALDLRGNVDRLVLLVLATPFLYWCLLAGDAHQGGGLWFILISALIVLALLPGSGAEYLSFRNPLSPEGNRITVNFWMRLLVAAVLFLGALRDDVVQVTNHAKAPPNQPSLQLLQVARTIDEPGAILAPWWLSPGLLYFSGHPIVSGTSHEGMSGIVDSARFFTSTSWTDAEAILDRRKVRWVVVWDNPDLVYPVLANAQSILGLPIVTDEQPGNAEQTVVQMLIEDQLLPTSMQLRGVVEQGNQKFKLYEYVPSG